MKELVSSTAVSLLGTWDKMPYFNLFLWDFTWKPLMNWLTLLSCACAMHCTFVTVWPLFCSILFTFIFWYLLMVLSVHAHSVQYCYILCHLVHLFCHKHAYLYLTKPIFFVQHCRIIRVYTLRMVNVVLDGRIKVRVFWVLNKQSYFWFWSWIYTNTPIIHSKTYWATKAVLSYSLYNWHI